jgi:hypothetical protein
MCDPVQEASSSASRCERALHAGNRPPFASSSDTRRDPSSIACVVDSRRGPSSSTRAADHRRLPSSRTCAAVPRRLSSSKTCAADRPFERAIARRTGFVGDRRALAARPSTSVENFDVRPRSRSQFVRFAVRTGAPRGKSAAVLVFVRHPSSSVVEHPCCGLPSRSVGEHPCRRPSSTSVVEHPCRRPSSTSVVENLCRGPPVRTSDSETNWLCR